LKEAFSYLISHSIDFKKIELKIAKEGVKFLESSPFEIVPKKKLLMSRVLSRLASSSLTAAFHLWKNKVEYLKKNKRVTIPEDDIAYLQQVERDLRL
jgi:histone H3/H4